MAKEKTETKSKFEYEYKKDYQSDWSLHSDYIGTFDAFEAMLMGQVYDSTSNSVDGSKITDSYATTLAIERAARVMGKLPEGVVESGSKADQGKAAFMDILRQKYIYPGANSQHSFQTKLRLWQLYSTVYGYMPMFYDWNISNSGYIGPDCWLWNPRNLIPQQGRVSIADMDYVTALTWVSKKYLEEILENEPEDEVGDGWDRDAIQELVDQANQPTGPDSQRDTMVERTRISQGSKKGICVATRYEAGDEGKWISFCPDNGFVKIRELDNPHKNGRIPFVIKYSQPLFDSFYGLGDFQRAKPLQFARDGLTNFYFKGIKMNLIPPIIANANGVLKHTLDYREGAVMMETIPNSIRRLETSSAGLATYQGAQSNLTGSLLSLYGSQNASIPGAEALNPSQGKTPAAVNMYSDKEASRDGQERMYLEEAIESLTDGFFSLVINIGTEGIPIGLYSDDIQEIVDSGLSDVEGLFSNFQPNATQTGGELKIDPTKLKGAEYRFNITSGTTAKVQKQEQLAELENMMANIAKFQNQFKDDPSIEVNWAEIMRTYESLSNVKGAKKFVAVKSSEEVRKLKDQQAQAEQQQMQAQEAAKAGGNIATQMAGQAMQPQEAPQAPEPTFGGGGAYSDPLLAQAAEHLTKL